MPMPRLPFLPLRTFASTAIILIAMITLEVLLFLPALSVGYDILDNDKPFPFLCLLHVGVWLLLALISRYHEHCHRHSRMRGYLTLYRDTLLTRKAPFVVMSVGNAVLLVLALAWPLDDRANVGRLTTLQIVYSTELCICIPCWILYLVHINRFNTRRDPPDAHHDVLGALQQRSSGELDSDANPLASVLERQSDMIHFYKQHVASLSSQITRMSAQLQNYERGLGSIAER
eukprot:m.8441 g.8441  ORF g.8441 m.8441 type:complete len:231 (+) comp5224_c0_seq2:201-893(+)